jgi:hypothetical protein
VSDPFYNIKGGRMMNPEIGYRLKYYNLRVSLAAGFHFQRISYETRQYSCPYCEFASPPLTKVEITQDMNRVELIMTVGWK